MKRGLRVLCVPPAAYDPGNRSTPTNISPANIPPSPLTQPTTLAPLPKYLSTHPASLLLENFVVDCKA